MHTLVRARTHALVSLTFAHRYENFGMVWGGTWDPETPEDEDPFDWARTDPRRTSSVKTFDSKPSDTEVTSTAAQGCCVVL